jgi:hypothetical protein
VSDANWKIFQEHLGTAEQALEEAWDLNPKDQRIADKMITMACDLGKERKEMEKWFDRAMTLDTNNYSACTSKLRYLEPRWNGSKEAMLEFGHECFKSKKWGGEVRLVLVEAHRWVNLFTPKEDRPSYWKKKGVWSDIHGCFEQYFAANPEGRGWHHNYALYAWRCEQWDVLNRELKLLGDINYAYFGGKDEFNKMVADARQHSSKPAKKP